MYPGTINHLGAPDWASSAVMALAGVVGLVLALAWKPSWQKTHLWNTSLRRRLSGQPPTVEALGRRHWVIAEGYIPSASTGTDREFVSHETACIVNTGSQHARVQLTLFFADRPPAGPYAVDVGAERCLHLRFNDLQDPEPVPRDTDYASVIVSDVPVVVQHTRLDTRQPALALLSTVAWGE